MEISIFVSLTIIFLYVLYKLVKDDYVLIRKNISLEHIFDVAFLTLLSGLFMARLFFFLFNTVREGNILLLFFSPGVGGFSLTGGILGGILTLYLVGKAKKAPIGRLFDFFTFAFLSVLPVGFVSYAFFQKQFEMFLFFLYAFLYLLLGLFYFKSLYPKILSKTQREGNSALLFLLFFSLASLCTSVIDLTKGTITVLSFENGVLVLLFIVSVGLLIRQEKFGKGRRK